MNAYQNSYLEKENSQELELENLTQRYLRGEINLDDYQKKVKLLERRIDLRRVASKLRLATVSVEESSK